MSKQASIGPVRCGCLNCPPKPDRPSMGWQPHPGFGMLELTRDGETPDWWQEFSYIVGWVYCIDQGWRTTTIAHGQRAGQTTEWFDGDWYPERPVEAVTLGEIEECCASDSDHDWRLRVEGPLGGAVYQRHGEGEWHPIERLDGFA